MDNAALERGIGYRFQRPELLQQALTHRSHSAPHNERLEFLGDGVLNCVIADELYRNFSTLKEGDLSRLRAHLVRQESLHLLAQNLHLGDFLQLGEGEIKSGGFNRPSILADTFEALVGAAFLDGGFEGAQQLIRHLLKAQIETLDPKLHGKDAKTQLQELLQGRHMNLPSYSVVATQGAAHSQLFEVECAIDALQIRTTGSGTSRRLAEQEAAMLALQKIQP
jgi:ribonuclease-3